MQPKQARIRIEAINQIVHDHRNDECERENKVTPRRVISQGFIPTEYQDEYDDLIKKFEDQDTCFKYSSSGSCENDSPLSLLEMCSYQTWFEIHPEKVLGTQKITTSTAFSVKTIGKREEVERLFVSQMPQKSAISNVEINYINGDLYKLESESTDFIQEYMYQIFERFPQNETFFVIQFGISGYGGGTVTFYKEEPDKIEKMIFKNEKSWADSDVDLDSNLALSVISHTEVQSIINEYREKPIRRVGEFSEKIKMSDDKRKVIEVKQDHFSIPSIFVISVYIESGRVDLQFGFFEYQNPSICTFTSYKTNQLERVEEPEFPIDYYSQLPEVQALLWKREMTDKEEQKGINRNNKDTVETNPILDSKLEIDIIRARRIRVAKAKLELIKIQRQRL